MAGHRAKRRAMVGALGIPVSVQDSGLRPAAAPSEPVHESPTSRARKPTVPKGWQDRFLEEFGATGIVSRACQLAGVSRRYVYQYRERNEAFAKKWKEAAQLAFHALEDVATARAMSVSDQMLKFLLEKRGAETYGPTLTVNQTVEGTMKHEVSIDLKGMPQDELIRLYAEQVRLPAERAAALGLAGQCEELGAGDGGGEGCGEG